MLGNSNWRRFELSFENAACSGSPSTKPTGRLKCNRLTRLILLEMFMTVGTVLGHYFEILCKNVETSAMTTAATAAVKKLSIWKPGTSDAANHKSTTFIRNAKSPKLIIVKGSAIN